MLDPDNEAAAVINSVLLMQGKASGECHAVKQSEADHARHMHWLKCAKV
jgi:hypothetical protein